MPSKLWLGLPRSDAQAEVVAISQRDRLDVLATDLGVYPLSLGSVDPDAPALVEAVAYGQSLESIGFTPGPLPTVGDGDALPQGLGVFVARVEEGATEGWSAIEPKDSILARLRFSRGPCPRFTATPKSVPGATQNASFALGLADGSALLSFRDGLLFRFAAGELTRVTSSTIVVYTAGARVGEQLHLGTKSGSLVRARLEGMLVEEDDVALGLPEEVEALAVEDSGDRILITITGQVYREHRGSFSPLHDFESDGLERAGGVVREPAGVVVYSESSTKVLRVLPTEQQEIEITATAGITAATFVEGLGTVLVTAEGSVFALGQDEVRELAGSPLRVYSDAVAPFRDGFVMGSAFGTVGVYLPGVPGGYCPLEQLAGFAVYGIVQVSTGLILAGSSTGDSAIVELTPR
ncbi:MAG: hypothetical protein HY791_03570 [Deltaproteobacteria bacterium]|nr:hypothetical protein [Deltaproteobacteria bacterium]